MNAGTAAVLLAVLLGLAPAAAEPLVLEGSLMQGGLVQGRAAPGVRLVLDGRAVALAPDGSFVIGFGRDAPPVARLEVVWPDGRKERRELAVARRTYAVQRIDGLPRRQVTPAPEDLARIRKEAERLRAARRRVSPAAWFRSGFVWPAAGRISSIYGSRRVLNGEPRQPHLGVDVAGPEGTPVVAAADGVVALVERDMFFTGTTLVIDHGLGLSSIYAHLSAASVRPGERVTRGQPVGRMGRSGRVTGPHLHWSLSWFEERLDPSLAIAPQPVALGAVVGQGQGAVR